MHLKNKDRRLSIPNHLIDFKEISPKQFVDICFYFMHGKEISEEDWKEFVAKGIATKTLEGYFFTKENQCEVLA